MPDWPTHPHTICLHRTAERYETIDETELVRAAVSDSHRPDQVLILHFPPEVLPDHA